MSNISNISGNQNISRIGGIPNTASISVQQGGARATEYPNGTENIPNTQQAGDTQDVQMKKRMGIEPCQTCENRKYVDGSDDAGVSFKTPTKLAPSEAATKVRSHEMEHFTREAQNAREEGREVVSNTVQIFTSVCNECGKVYVSGGLTTTTTKASSQKDDMIARLMGAENKQADENSADTINRSIANKAYGLSYDARI